MNKEQAEALLIKLISMGYKAQAANLYDDKINGYTYTVVYGNTIQSVHDAFNDASGDEDYQKTVIVVEG